MEIICCGTLFVQMHICQKIFLMEGRFKSPYKFNLVLTPQILTYVRRKQMGKNSDLLPVGLPFWVIKDHFPLILHCFLIFFTAGNGRYLVSLQGQHGIEVQLGSLRISSREIGIDRDPLNFRGGYVMFQKSFACRAGIFFNNFFKRRV